VTAGPVSGHEAEVLVVVQDMMPYSISFGSNFSSRANAAIANRDIFGLGIELRAGTFINSQKERLMGYEAMLRLPNIGRSFVSIQADYLDRYEDQRFGFAIRKDFYAPTTKYAGHLSLYNARTPVRYFDYSHESPAIIPVTIRYHQLDAWIGRSFLINKKSFNEQRRNATVTLGAQSIHFIDRPEQSEELYYRFQNRTICLASFTYSQQAFYKTNMIYNFGRTEDIPYGYMLSVVSGKEINQMYHRPYLGANFSSGYFIPGFGYLSNAISCGTFFRNGKEQGVIDLEMNYFSSLYVIGNYRHRTFFNGKYTQQLYNWLYDMLVIDGEQGIPGFRADSVQGRQRFNLSVEQNLFTPWILYGFRFVLYGFAHFSWLGEYGTSSTLYSSFGGGVRIRNNRLIFNTLQIQIAYFPNIPKNSSFHYVNFSSEKLLQPRNFAPKAPEAIPLY
jgi:hypothetical protein